MIEPQFVVALTSVEEIFRRRWSDGRSRPQARV